MPGISLSDRLPTQLLEQINLGIVLVDQRGTVVWANEHQEEYTGLQPDQIIGESFFEYAAFRDSGLDEILRSVIRDGVKWSNPEPVPSFSRPISKKCRSEFLPVYEKDTIIGAAILFWDITDFANATSEAEKIKKQLSSILALISNDFFFIDRAFVIKKISQHLLTKQKKKPPAKIIGNVCYSVLYERQEPCPSCPAIICFEQGINANTEIPVNPGRKKTRRARAYPIKDERQNVLQVAVRCTGDDDDANMTSSSNSKDEDLQNVVDHLNSINAFNSQVLDTVPNKIVVIDEDYQIVYANKTCLVGANRNRDEIIGQNLMKTLDHFNSSELGKKTDRCLQTDESQTFIYRKFIAGSPEQFFKFTVSKIPNQSGLKLILILSEKITHIDQIVSYKICDEKYQSLSLFVAKIVHDIRNPLSTLMARTDFLKNFDVHQKGGENALMHEIDLLEEQANRIAFILEKIESLQPHSEEETIVTDLSTIVERAAVVVNIHRPCRNVHAELDIPSDLPQIFCRESNLEKAFYEIFKNALEAAGETGQVKVKASYFDKNGGYFEIRVKDTGPGIAPEVKNKIFDAFFTTKQGMKSAGLGMTTAYAYITQHQGKIDIKSELGVGTEVIITLPQKVEALSYS